MERDAFRDMVAQSLGTTADFNQLIAARLKSLAPRGRAGGMTTQAPARPGDDRGFSGKDFRGALGSFATGVTVVTTMARTATATA